MNVNVFHYSFQSVTTYGPTFQVVIRSLPFAWTFHECFGLLKTVFVCRQPLKAETLRNGHETVKNVHAKRSSMIIVDHIWLCLIISMLLLYYTHNQLGAMTIRYASVFLCVSQMMSKPKAWKPVKVYIRFHRFKHFFLLFSHKPWKRFLKNNLIVVD